MASPSLHLDVTQSTGVQPTGHARSTRRRSAGLIRASVLLVVLVCSLAAGCEVPGDDDARESGRSGLQRARVVRVVDGDTIVVRVEGREERVRYTGIDAPESVQPDAPVECFGPEASEANAELVAGQSVWLEADEENRDRYGRLLRYVYVEIDGERALVNSLLVERGYAEARHYPPNDHYQNLLVEAEATAEARGAGLWSACR